MKKRSINTYKINEHIFNLRHGLEALYQYNYGNIPQHIKRKIENLIYDLSNILEPNDEYNGWDIEDYIFYETFIYTKPEIKKKK